MLLKASQIFFVMRGLEYVFFIFVQKFIKVQIFLVIFLSTFLVDVKSLNNLTLWLNSVHRETLNKYVM